MADAEAAALQALARHPAVKSITPQRKVTRSIKAVDEEGDGEERELHEVESEEEEFQGDPCGDDYGVGGDCARYSRFIVGRCDTSCGRLRNDSVDVFEDRKRQISYDLNYG